MLQYTSHFFAGISQDCLVISVQMNCVHKSSFHCICDCWFMLRNARLHQSFFLRETDLKKKKQHQENTNGPTHIHPFTHTKSDMALKKTKQKKKLLLYVHKFDKSHIILRTFSGQGHKTECCMPSMA